jgi:hypothetical protein
MNEPSRIVLKICFGSIFCLVLLNYVFVIMEDSEPLKMKKIAAEKLTRKLKENYFESFYHLLKYFDSTARFVTHSISQGFLVHSLSCKIPSLDPFAPDVMEILDRERKKELKCLKTRPLTSIDQDFENDIVKVVYHPENEEIYQQENGTQLECYYKEISRTYKNDFSFE